MIALFKKILYNFYTPVHSGEYAVHLNIYIYIGIYVSYGIQS